MQKFLQKTIMLVIVIGIFLLPISPSFHLKNDGHLAVGVKTNEVQAQALTVAISSDGTPTATSAKFNLILYNTASYPAGSYVLMSLYQGPKGDATHPVGPTKVPFAGKDSVQSVPFSFSNLTPSTTYHFDALMKSTPEITPLPEIQIQDFTTADSSGNGGNGGAVTGANDVIKGDVSYGCDSHPSTWFTNCIVLALYSVLWSPVAKLATWAAEILDFFIYYSTNSNSYNSDFVAKGWGAVRDIANIFFIIALLYIAIKTILSLNTTDNKKLISYIVIVALLINFSLFFTQVIIDGSNILAKVFYNNIVSKDSKGNILPADPGGEKSISTGLVDKFDPQTIVSDIPNNLGTFLVILFVSLIMLGYMIYMFLSVSLLFVGRVVMLWISMIFAPIAFASYTLPFDIPGLGHKEWWKNLLENAFLAPIFIFMLYIIIMFGNFLKLIQYENGSDKFMKTIIPFFILFILLMKAKDMAVKYSGEMGKAMMKAGAMIGGAAVGVATGGAAMLGRQTLGRAAANISQSNKFRDWAAQSKFGKRVSKTVGGVASGSFDARGIKVAGKGLRDTGLKVGKNVKTGGFAKGREESVKKEEEYANKNLDTSDYGMAELTSGKMSEGKKNHVIKQMKGDFGTTKDKDGKEVKINEQAFRAKLQGGLDKKTARTVADKMNVARRGDRADYLGSKRFMTNKVKANKVRTDVGTIEKTRNLALTMAALATAQKATEGGGGKKPPAGGGGTPPPESKGPAAPTGGVPLGGVHS